MGTGGAGSFVSWSAGMFGFGMAFPGCFYFEKLGIKRR